jgi:hypothetical protein
LVDENYFVEPLGIARGLPFEPAGGNDGKGQRRWMGCQEIRKLGGEAMIPYLAGLLEIS